MSRLIDSRVGVVSIAPCLSKSRRICGIKPFTLWNTKWVLTIVRLSF
jgi:hypothetical protein